MNMKIGCIGQGYIGKSYADVIEAEGYDVVRYSLEPEYIGNKEKINECDIVIIAVPTPTTPEGSDHSLIEKVLPLTREGATVVIKSTLLPGTTKKLQEQFPNIVLIHSPEFLSRATAKEDVEKPKRNIFGVAKDTEEYRNKAKQVLAIIPKAPYELITTSNESEMIKYVNNTFFYAKTVFMNILYDFAMQNDCSWDNIKEAILHEPWIGSNHIDPVHRSGRGAGGPCLIKDFNAFVQEFQRITDDELGKEVLQALERKNLDLLKQTDKDQDEVGRVYGT